jgi:hypothetical protein
MPAAVFVASNELPAGAALAVGSAVSTECDSGSAGVERHAPAKATKPKNKLARCESWNEPVRYLNMRFPLAFS